MASDLLDRLTRVERRVRAEVDAALVAAGLTSAQATVLEVLQSQPEATAADLARACAMKPQSMMELVHRLEATGLLARSEATGRSRSLTVTARGTQALAQAQGITASVEARLLARLSPSERADLRFLLEQLSLNLTARPGVAPVTPRGDG